MKRTPEQRIADAESWYRGAPARNAPGPDRTELTRGAAFLASLPTGAVVEVRVPALLGAIAAPVTAFEIKR